jgi:hypothetical protein
VREISNVVVDNKNYSPFDTGASTVLLHGLERELTLDNSPL